MTKEQLAKQIMAEYEKDGEPCTYEEALEVAEMELKATENRHYEQSKVKKERKAPTRKEDINKQWLITTIKNCLNIYTPKGIADLEITNKEKTIDFTYNGASYTLMLTKHRPPK